MQQTKNGEIYMKKYIIGRDCFVPRNDDFMVCVIANKTPSLRAKRNNFIQMVERHCEQSEAISC